MPPERPSASAAAAGLVNLATGLRPGFTRHAATLLQAFHTWLTTLPAAAQAAWHPLPIYKPFNNTAHLNDWYAASATAPPGMHVTLHTQPQLVSVVHNPLGGVWLEGGGWMDVPLLLAALKQHLQAQPAVDVHHKPLDYAIVDAANKLIRLTEKPIAYHHLVFAEGIYVNSNPLRPFRPLQPMKGELLRVRLAGIDTLPFILISGVYVLPCGEYEYLVGSTYQNHFTTPQPSAEGLADLLARLQVALPGLGQPPEVLGHLAGLRPTTPDRLPLVGAHPQHGGIHFLNGLGTKGVLYGVWATSLLMAPPPELLPTRRTLAPQVA